jgi:RNA polymerase sigma-70 factor (ECF subfamily)
MNATKREPTCEHCGGPLHRGVGGARTAPGDVGVQDDPFEAHRAHLFGVAYRMLGSAAEADDVLQEAWLRVRDVPDAEMRSPRAYLTSVVVRLCLDVLRSSRVKREAYVGPWLPEPIPSVAHDERASSLSFALLLLLESLSPLERAVFLLHEVFDYTHAEIAAVLERDEAAVRKLLSRAKEHVREGRPRFSTRKEDHERLLGQFVATIATGDLAGLEAILADGVTTHSDGGGRVQAALKVVSGRGNVARLWTGLAKKLGPVAYAATLREINGTPSIVLTIDGVIDQVLSIDTDGEKITAVYSVRNPEKLSRVS